MMVQEQVCTNAGRAQERNEKEEEKHMMTKRTSMERNGGRK